MLQQTKKQSLYMMIAFAFFMVIFNSIWVPWAHTGYIPWFKTGDAHIIPKLLLGLLLFGVLFWSARIGFRAKGVIGVGFFLALFGGLVYWGIDTTFIPIQKDLLIEIAYTVASAMLAIGMRASILKRLVSGQLLAEDPDTESHDHDG